MKRRAIVLVLVLLSVFVLGARRWPTAGGGGGGTAPGTTAEEVITTDGSGTFQAVTGFTAQVSGGNIVIDVAAGTDGQSDHLKEATGNEGDQWAYGVPDNINASADLPDVTYTTTGTVGAGANIEHTCWKPVDAVNLDADECPLSLKSECTTISTDAEDCDIELASLDGGSKEVILTYDGSDTTAEARLTLLASSIGTTEIADGGVTATDLASGLCFQQVGVPIRLANDATDHHHSMVTVETGAAAPASLGGTLIAATEDATIGNVDDWFVLGTAKTLDAIRVDYHPSPAGTGCTIAIETSAAEIGSCGPTTGSFCIALPDASVSALSTVAIESNCAADSTAADWAVVTMCLSP